MKKAGKLAKTSLSGLLNFLFPERGPDHTDQRPILWGLF